MTAAPKKILIVDDNLFVLGTLALAFEKEGFVALKAESAEEATRILENQQPDIILSDYEMPGINGFAFRKQLLQDPTTKNIPFVFLTAHSDNELVMEGLDELMAVDFIDKGTPLPVIISKMNNLLTTVMEKQALQLAELRKAAEAINLKAVPEKKPAVNGFDIDFWHQPYHGYPGGDFIDFINTGNKVTFIVLGDVMGKKWGAWFFTFGFLSYVRAAIRFFVSNGDYNLAVILRKMNELVCQDEMLADVLAGLSLLMIDGQTGNVAYAGAGDLPLLHYNRTAGTLTEVKTPGLSLGLFADADYDYCGINMAEGDQLLIFSDGVIDIKDGNKSKSDYALFKKNIAPLLQKQGNFSAIEQYLQETLGGGHQADDCSIISVIKK